ncbi:hypothetical protein LRR81_14075 [Metabacillus sp. GX 13764]|uniref:sigma factor-like helix-turn-helix DNA-binding protein n=1 Tax=Metabacillus kandeliae TaxID=2900151 RepID=UPI001E65ABE6|nr:sigma factor-like helix-turn-helix DNA-binding protein [Metabacillus kandeliae]MCD7035368.1 hypothetical protein [Metabacillus kandeliae]
MTRYKNLNEYKKKNAEFLEQPIVKSFFDSNSCHLQMLESAIIGCDTKARIELDKQFINHFYFYRLAQYVSVLSHNYSVDFDKSKRKQREHFPLILDRPIENSEKGTSTLDYLSYKSENTHQIEIKDSSLNELVGDEILSKILNNLSDKEKKVLHLIIIQQLKQVEVAKLFGETPQNIAKIKKKTLEKIKKEYRKGVSKDDK